MREVCAQTGLEAATRRMWEQRHGFPEPARLPSGHRRYSPRDVELITQVVRDREAGLELRAAIDRAKHAPAQGPGDAPADSIFAGLRRRRPHLQPYLLPKSTLLAVSHAIEDECGAGAERAMLFASFQRERFYRAAEARWRDLAGPARSAIVMADFERLAEPPGAPVEVPIDRSDPIGREWSLICDAPAFAACLSGWERPGQEDVEDSARVFEMFWSVEPELVREASLVACAIAERGAPAACDPIRPALAEPVSDRGGDRAKLTSLTNRMIAYLGGVSTRLPAPRSSAEA
jgi:DICT domain-containing protein